ncbi:interferon regulatory factor 1b isoform X2 [Leuresthes tenuis]|uniref:interferon regulatory factor 1b isoform X2 n=1 Tax=Leuresthes tenuis TaxID=355514 RepID=UPI003B5026D7
MPVSRMRMRPWLEMMIESNSISGLTWVDKEKTMFSIPWKHAARHGWELNKDACLFKEWAIHTGKYVEGQTCDPKTWKANFRCAMNSLVDIEEVKHRSINKGHQAMRVFKMLPAAPKCREKRSNAKEIKQRKKSTVVKTEDDTDYSDTHSPLTVSLPEDTSSTQENTLDNNINIDQDDFPLMPPSEVPDLSLTVEIGLEPFSQDFHHRFEVSPDHCPDYASLQDIIEICQQNEKDSQRMYHADCRGILSNDACTSPGSQWSEHSSGEELDDTPQYTTLGTDFTPSTDEIWDNLFQMSL